MAYRNLLVITKMYKVIRNPKKIAAAQKHFLIATEKALPFIDGTFTIGHQGDNFLLDNLRSNGIIWFGNFKLDDAAVPRYWNGFGLASQLVSHGSNTIITEANVALDGNHPRAKSVAAFFAEDESGRIALLHTGKIGGGRVGVGKSEFLAWYKGETVNFTQSNDSNATDSAILVSSIDSWQVAENIGGFVESVAQFKAGSEYSERAGLSDKDLENKAKSAKRRPKVKITTKTTYSRNPHVAEYVKRRAGGRCDLCKTDAPFSDSHDQPYLECHHIVWLAHDGDDSIDNTVALCPNCHRRMHILKNCNDVKKLKLCATNRL